MIASDLPSRLPSASGSSSSESAPSAPCRQYSLNWLSCGSRRRNSQRSDEVRRICVTEPPAAASICRMRSSSAARPAMRSSATRVASACARIHCATAGSAVFSRKRYGSASATPQWVSTTGGASGGGGAMPAVPAAAAVTAQESSRARNRLMRFIGANDSMCTAQSLEPDSASAVAADCEMGHIEDSPRIRNRWPPARCGTSRSAVQFTFPLARLVRTRQEL